MNRGFLRRVLHVSTAGVLAIGWAWDWRVLSIVLWAAVPVAVIVEVARLKSETVRAAFARTVPVFREGEAKNVSGAMWLVIGYAGASMVPFPGAPAGILTAALADPTAAAVGIRWGRGARKSWVGTAAALLAAVVTLAVLRVGPVSVVVGGVVAAALERWSWRLNDNLLIGPGVALAVWLTQ